MNSSLPPMIHYICEVSVEEQYLGNKNFYWLNDMGVKTLIYYQEKEELECTQR